MKKRNPIQKKDNSPGESYSKKGALETNQDKKSKSKNAGLKSRIKRKGQGKLVNQKPSVKTEPIVENEENPLIRLNRYIANSGVCSRRDADKLITAGEIKVNGKVIDELGYKVKDSDNVVYNGKRLKREKFVYVLLNKPKDFITTTDDPNDRKTVMQLVANSATERIYPVGRLDRNTTGLLLFTNDGDLAKQLSHPSHNVKKIYQVEINKPLESKDFEKIQGGLTLEDGEVKIDEMAIISDDGKTIGLEIHLGRNRIVRRIFEHLNYEVVKLDRVQFASLTKKDLKRGNWRYLSEREVIKLKHLR